MTVFGDYSSSLNSSNNPESNPNHFSIYSSELESDSFSTSEPSLSPHSSNKSFSFVNRVTFLLILLRLIFSITLVSRSDIPLIVESVALFFYAAFFYWVVKNQHPSLGPSAPFLNSPDSNIDDIHHPSSRVHNQRSLINYYSSTSLRHFSYCGALFYFRLGHFLLVLVSNIVLVSVHLNSKLLGTIYFLLCLISALFLMIVGLRDFFPYIQHLEMIDLELEVLSVNSMTPLTRLEYIDNLEKQIRQGRGTAKLRKRIKRIKSGR